MTVRLRLLRGQRRRMIRLLKKTNSKLEASRARILLLLHDQVSPSQIARLVACARSHVYHTLARFDSLGELALYDQRQFRLPTKVTPPVELWLWTYLGASPQTYGWHRQTWTLEL